MTHSHLEAICRKPGQWDDVRYKLLMYSSKKKPKNEKRIRATCLYEV